MTPAESISPSMNSCDSKPKEVSSAGGTDKTNQRQDKMGVSKKEVCLFLLIVFTTYASYNSKVHLEDGTLPTPFFRKNSLVSDFYKGELQDARVCAAEADLSFIMYYAPWDTESQEARRQFEAVATQHSNQVYFAGINCWQPHSNCKRNLNKIQQFPKFVAYIAHETGVEYRGPVDSQYMSVFLQSAIRPLFRLNSPTDLTRLRTAFHVVVVAFLKFNGSLGGSSYRTMYESALKYLEKDVRQEVVFAVVTSFKTSMEMGIDKNPSIRLYLWNETLEYNGPWVSDRLVDWVSSRSHQVAMWLNPPGSKSLTLAQYINQSPVLILFTPFDNFVMFHLLREVGLEYYNCKQNSDISQLASNISKYVSERITQAKNAMLSCKSRLYGPILPLQIARDTNISCGPNIHTRSRCYSQCGIKPFSQQNIISLQSDPLSAVSLTEESRQEACNHLSPPPARLVATPLAPAIQGLACRHNRTISLIALDSRLTSHFAIGLGIHPVQVGDNSQVVLLNPQMETTHVLSGPITRATLSQFLVDFTEGKLERLQRSHSATLDSQASPSTSAIVSLTELNTDSFLTVAFNNSLNVVVLLHTRYCAFCDAVNHVYLSLAHLMRDVPSLLFTRIDGEINDLPWHFTAPHYPSVLFFPAKRKAESRMFPAQIDVTLDSLTNFVLANLPLELRLLALVESCQRYMDLKVLSRQRECLLDVRREVLETISTLQARYHSLLSIPNYKSKLAELGKVLTRLRHMKQLQSSLSVDSQRTPQLTKLILYQLLESADSDWFTTPTRRIRDEL